MMETCNSGVLNGSPDLTVVQLGIIREVECELDIHVVIQVRD